MGLRELRRIEFSPSATDLEIIEYYFSLLLQRIIIILYHFPKAPVSSLGYTIFLAKIEKKIKIQKPMWEGDCSAALIPVQTPGAGEPDQCWSCDMSTGPRSVSQMTNNRVWTGCRWTSINESAAFTTCQVTTEDQWAIDGCRPAASRPRELGSASLIGAEINQCLCSVPVPQPHPPKHKWFIVTFQEDWTVVPSRPLTNVEPSTHLAERVEGWAAIGGCVKKGGLTVV